jgi:endonuclease V-like protein UPF0215 family
LTKTRPHLIGVDDGPFEKRQAAPVPIVAAMLEGAGPVESLAVSAFPVDGADVTGFLAGWLAELRALGSVQAVLLGGISLAGLGIVDLPELARCLERPVVSVTRRRPSNAELCRALEAAGLADRIAIVERSPRAVRLDHGLYVAHAGASAGDAARLVRAGLGKAGLPEPLRLAHLIARAIVLGESRGRV